MLEFIFYYRFYVRLGLLDIPKPTHTTAIYQFWSCITVIHQGADLMPLKKTNYNLKKKSIYLCNIF